MDLITNRKYHKSFPDRSHLRWQRIWTSLFTVSCTYSQKCCWLCSYQIGLSSLLASFIQPPSLYIGQQLCLRFLAVMLTHMDCDGSLCAALSREICVGRLESSVVVSGHRGREDMNSWRGQGLAPLPSSPFSLHVPTHPITAALNKLTTKTYCSLIFRPVKQITRMNDSSLPCEQAGVPRRKPSSVNLLTCISSKSLSLFELYSKKIV